METELKAALEKVKKHMRVTKVTCTRSVKGRNGDSYVGYSAAWDTIQDDAGGATDEQISSQTDAEVKSAQSGGLTLKESRLASLVLGMQVDVAAHDHAMAGGNIPQDQHDLAVKAIKGNYSRLMVEALKNGNGNGGGEKH